MTAAILLILRHIWMNQSISVSLKKEKLQREASHLSIKQEEAVCWFSVVLVLFFGVRVIWKGGAHPTNCLYSASQEFEAVFFEKAYVPTAPKTSYDDIDFAELLKQQNSEYQIASPFSIEGNLTYFLKPDGIVFSMSAPYVLGDHFEAQMNYNDIEKFYLPEQKYWESKK